MSAPTGNNLDIRAWEKQLKRSLDFLDRRFPEDYGHAVLMFLCSGEAPIHCAINLQRADRRQQAEQYIRWYGTPIHRRDIYLGVANYAVAPSGKAGATRTKAMVGHVRALYCERDEAMLGAEVPKPSYTIATSLSRFQDYWELDQPISGADAEPYLRRIAAACGLGNQAVDCARVLRLPGTQNFKPDRNGEIVTVLHDNNIVYTLEDFAHLPQVATGHASRSASNGASDERKIPEGARHSELVRAAGSMRHFGIGKEHIYEALAGMNLEQCAPPLEDAEVRRIADSATWQPEPPPAIRKSKATNGMHSDEKPAVDPETGEILSDLPCIDAGNHNLPVVTRQAWAALEAANDPPHLFRHAGGVARLDVDEDGHPVLRPVTTRTLRHEVARAADWYVVKKHGTEPAVPPQHVTENMLEVPTPPVPLLERIAHAPFFAPDWTLVMEPGYHAASRSYLIMDDLHLAPIPVAPSRDELRQARDLVLDQLFVDFPFVGDADRANAVALALLPYARPAIPGATPLHLIEASTPGTGKGLLADVATRPAVGTHVGVMTQPQDNDEMRKRLTARLREGAPVILLDNIVHTLNSGDLAAALTADTWTDRILGSTETINVPVRCIWVGSGNNVTMSTELARRLIRIRLDAMIDRPWQRTGFRHENLIKWADEHRADLIHAALVLIQAWVAAGKPEGATTLGSFERWATIMGGILDNAGVHGFLDNCDAFYEEADTEGAIWRQFTGLWWEKFGEKEVTAADLYPLTDAVEGLDVGKGNDKAQRTAFGMLLAKQRDRVFGDYRIVFARVAHKAKMWRLVPTAIKPLIPPDYPAQGEPRGKGSPPVSPCDTRRNGEGGEPRGTYSNATHEEFLSFYSQEGQGQKAPQGSPSADSSTDFPLPHKEKSGGEPFSAGTAMTYLAMEAWAKDIESDWGSSPENLACAKAAAQAHLHLTIPDDAMEMMTADLIVAAMKGGR